MRDSRSSAYATRPRLPKPFGFRAASVLLALSVPFAPVCPYLLPKVGYWQFPGVSVCTPVFEGKKDLPAYTSRALFLEHCSSHSDFVSVFSDGSKFDTGVGFSVVFPFFCRGGSLPAVASVFIAELSAIVLALRTIFTLPVNSFVIFSDSRRIISALNYSTPFIYPLVLSAALVLWLYLLSNKGYRVGFCWVPGNERDNRIAREAAGRVATLSPFPCTDMFPAIREATIGIWQERWDARGVTSKMGEVTRTVSHPWNYSKIRERRLQTALTRLRIGHTRLTYSYLMSGGYQPYCDDCLVPLTVRHLLVECPSLVELRQRFLYRYRGADGGFSLSRVLGPAYPSPGYEVIYFLETGLLSLL